MTMHIHNTLTKQTEPFVPLEPDQIHMYVCGLTPYDKAHIGHARTYVAFDLIKRWLYGKGFKVFHIQNITDVDDKIIKRCRETGADPKRLTEDNHRDALEAFGKLDILPANVYPKVTENISEIIAIVQEILAKGFAYETKTGVYFDVSKFKHYGSLSGQKMDEIKSGSRKDVDESKEDPADFALWKKTNGDLIEFDSPWGKGRPGWHIECSAMARKYAKTLDIHGGARDLIFPHHENEIAQSEAANGQKFVKYWMHTGFLTVNGEKMSKSLGNFVTVSEVLSKFQTNAIRMFFALTHYRSPIDYNEESIGAAGESAERLLNAIGLANEALREKEKMNTSDPDFRKESKRLMEEMNNAMDNDFDTPTAIAAMFNLIRVTNTHLSSKAVDYEQLEQIKDGLATFSHVLGITEPKTELATDEIAKLLATIGGKGGARKPEEMLDELVALRDAARKNRDYALSDRIRKELETLGIVLEDDHGKTKWKARA